MSIQRSERGKKFLPDTVEKSTDKDENKKNDTVEYRVYQDNQHAKETTLIAIFYDESDVREYVRTQNEQEYYMQRFYYVSVDANGNEGLEEE